MRLYFALRGCSCGSSGFRRGPDDGHNHRQGATSSTSRTLRNESHEKPRYYLFQCPPPVTAKNTIFPSFLVSGKRKKETPPDNPYVAYCIQRGTAMRSPMGNDRESLEGGGGKWDNKTGESENSDLDNFSRIHTASTPPRHAPCDLPYLVPVFVGLGC